MEITQILGERVSGLRYSHTLDTIGNKNEILLDTARWMNCINMFEQKKPSIK